MSRSGNNAVGCNPTKKGSLASLVLASTAEVSASSTTLATPTLQHPTLAINSASRPNYAGQRYQTYRVLGTEYYARRSKKSIAKHMLGSSCCIVLIAQMTWLPRWVSSLVAILPPGCIQDEANHRQVRWRVGPTLLDAQIPMPVRHAKTFP